MMRILSRILVIPAMVLFLGMVAARADEPKASKEKAPAKMGAKEQVVWPVGDLKWVSTAEAPPEVKMAVLWGDPEKGPHGALHKFPPGFKAALHTHSSDMHCVVVSGTLIHGTDGGSEKKLPAGSYLYLPSTYKHTTACDKSSECILFVDSKGKFDVKMVEEKKEGAKKEKAKK